MSDFTLNTGKRKAFIIGFVCLIIFLYIGQLFFLQVVDEGYKDSADSNAFLKRTRFPSRGMMYDRYNNLVVYNQSAYDVMVVLKETKTFDTLAFCRIVDIDIDYFRKRLGDIRNRNLNPGYSPYTPQIFLTQLGQKEYGQLQEVLYKFPGFYIQQRTVRQYNYPNAGHVLGYISEVDKEKIAEDNYYMRGDYAGKTGIEFFYEKDLRGEKGVEILLRDSRGRIKGKYEEGKLDTDPVAGRDLTLSIDMELQAYGEELMQNKLGSIIMIEPSTGEILCMVSSPGYDPATLVGREFGNGYQTLVNDPYTPLINRALNGVYPPGSTFKTAQGLVFLEEDIIQSSTSFTCNHGFPANGGRPRCHGHASPLALSPAIATSCNSYFCWGMKGMLENRRKYQGFGEALDKWRDHMVGQGFGYKLGVDLPGEKRGLIPNSQYYDKIYNGRWNAFTIISVSIGQGEVLATPLQICNLAASIANRGYYHTPHIVKSISDNELDTLYTKRNSTSISPEHYEPIALGMMNAVIGGTCRGAYMPDLQVCGKTGTAENAGKDHSIFMGFAPKEAPKVAISVYVENGGFGARYAVPIGRLMIEKYIRREIPQSSKWIEENMKNAVILRNVLQKN